MVPSKTDAKIRYKIRFKIRFKIGFESRFKFRFKIRKQKLKLTGISRYAKPTYRVYRTWICAGPH